jgi:uncharacterized membrane protein
MFAAAVYGVSSWICHQRPERSFFIWATQMPVCARCAAIYGGGAAGAVLFGARRSIASRSVGRDRAILIAAVTPSVLTLVAEWGFGSTPSNLMRALAGLPIGVVVAWFVLRAEVN